MKILFYINTLYDGGAERVLSNLANQFDCNKDDVIVVTSVKNENDYILNQGVKRIILEEKEIESNRLVKNYKRIKMLHQNIKKEKPDLVIGFMAEANFRVILANFGLKSKTIVSVRNDPNKEYPNSIYRFLAKTLYKLADGIVFQTEDAKKWFSKSIQKKSAIIMNQVAEEFFDVEIDKDAKDIVALGRYNSQKNYPLLINAYSIAKNKIGDVKLKVYGMGELKDDLQKMVDEKGLHNDIILNDSTNDVKSVLSKSKYYVLSSDYEGVPNALLEAMAAGLVCISTDCPCGGPKILIRHEHNGILVSVGSKVELANAIVKVVNDDNLASKLSINAKESMKQYKPENVFSIWNEYCKSVVNKESK